MTIRFYSWPRSSGSRVQWALEELGLQYEYIKLDRSKNEHKSADYLAINPNGTMVGASLGDRPAVAAWLGRCAGRPALARAE